MLEGRETAEKEMCTRAKKLGANAIAEVGNNVRWEYDHLQRAIGPDQCTLVWEKGGHFATPHFRLARAFAWCINSLTK